MSLEVPLGEVAPPTPLVVIPHVVVVEEEEEEEEEGKHIYHWKHKIICKIIITKCRLMA